MDTIFDESSGISLEEQKEIYASLDTLDHLETAAPGQGKKPSKRGGFLPLIVNSLGIALLITGLLAVFLSHKQEATALTLGDFAPLGVTEQKLIEEIRREIAAALSQKEAEIADILARIAGIDSEMQDVRTKFDNNTILEDERDLALAALQRQKEEYQTRLSALQAERGQLLEDARVRESALRRVRSANTDLTGRLESVQAELKTLSDEQERNALIDGQVNGYFTEVNNKITAGDFESAASSLVALKDFLNTPSFQNNRAFLEQKPARLTLVASLSALTDKARAVVVPQITPVEQAPAVPDTSAADAEKLREYEKIIADLTQQKNDLESALSESRSESTSAGSSADSLRTQNQTLRETLASRESALTAARAQTASLQETLTTRENDLAAAKSQTETLQQSISEKDASIATLQSQNSNLQTQVDLLQTQNNAIRNLLAE